MCAVNEFLYFVAFGSILISHTHTHICTHMHVGAMGCCGRVCERERHRLRTGEKKRNHVPRRLLPPLLLLLCPPSRMAYIFIYNFSFHFICAFFSPSSLWLIFGTALFWHFKNKHSFFRFSCPNFSPTVARAKLFRLLFCTVLDFTLYIFIYIRFDAMLLRRVCVLFSLSSVPNFHWEIYEFSANPTPTTCCEERENATVITVFSFHFIFVFVAGQALVRCSPLRRCCAAARCAMLLNILLSIRMYRNVKQFQKFENGLK